MENTENMKLDILNYVNESFNKSDLFRIVGNKIHFNEIGYNSDELNIEIVYTNESKERIKGIQLIDDKISINLKNNLPNSINFEKIIKENNDYIVGKISKLMVKKINTKVVSKIFEMGELNRSSAPSYNGPLTNIKDQTIFDLDTSFVIGNETTHSVQRKLITKMVFASNYIATEGRVGPAQFAVTNGAMAASLMDIAGYIIDPQKTKLKIGSIYQVGHLGDIQIYVDANMRYNDNRICMGRTNEPNSPGISLSKNILINYIKNEKSDDGLKIEVDFSYSIIENKQNTEKQYMVLVINDEASYLN